MPTSRQNLSRLSVLWALCVASLVTGCASTQPLGDPQEGDAFLRIIGESQVEIGDGTPRTLKVRYEDSQGNPLAGEIYFTMVGDAAGSQLSEERLQTDSNGEATVTLLPPVDVSNDVDFQIKAGAVYARDARWNVLVYSGSVGTLKIAGTYDVDSSFDLLQGIPGKVGDLVRDLESMTEIDENDGRYGLVSWALDKLTTSPDVAGAIRTLVSGMRPSLDAAAYELINDFAPDWVEALQTTADRVLDFARHFETQSKLTIVDNGDGTYTATHELLAFVFDEGSPVTLASLGFGGQVVEGIAVTVNGRHVDLASHSFNVSYGAVLLWGVNKYLVPELADLFNIDNANEADSLGDLLNGLIDCEGVADWISNEGSVVFSVAESACRSGVRLLGGFLEDKIRGIGGDAGLLTIAGSSTARVGHDDSVEKLQGEWAGALKMAGLTSALEAPNQTFIATPTGGVQ